MLGALIRTPPKLSIIVRCHAICQSISIAAAIPVTLAIALATTVARAIAVAMEAAMCGVDTGIIAYTENPETDPEPAFPGRVQKSGPEFSSKTKKTLWVCL